MYIPVKGFAPDLPPETPGILTECDGFVSSVTGIKAVNTGANAGFTTISSSAVGMFSFKGNNELRVTFAGTATQLYKSGDGVFNDVTRAGGNYTVPAGDYWTFAQYGNTTLAAQAGDRVQVYTEPGPFADMTQTVSAKIVEVVNNQAMLFNTVDEYGTQQDRWRCSALGNIYDWVPDISTQAATNRLVDSPGPIEAAKKFGDDVIVYKDTSMYRGVYTGPPFVWEWVLISNSIGTTGTHAVVSIGDPVPIHFFVGPADFYIYDGSRPFTIGTEGSASIITNWFFNNLNLGSRDKIIGINDAINWNVYWFFPNTSSTGELNAWVAYNYRTRQWGKGTLNVDMVGDYYTPDLTYHGVGTAYATYNDIPTTSYDTLFVGTPSLPKPSFFVNGKMYTLDGAPGTNTFKTSYVGTDNNNTLINRVRPRFSGKPTSGTQHLVYVDGIGDTDVTAGSSTLIAGAFDKVHEARWLAMRMSFTGSTEITGLDIQAEGRSLE